MVAMNNYIRNNHSLKIYLKKKNYFQIFSSEVCFIDLTSTFIDLHVVVEKSNNQKPSAFEGLSYEKCELLNLFRLINAYINRKL